MLPRPRLLVADDHLIFAQILGQWFGTRFDVQEPVTQLAELGPAMRRCRPDLLLLDIQFGRESALDFLPDIASRKETRIMMFTARADVRCVVTAFQAGAVGYFLKEDGVEELSRAVDQVLAGVRYIAPELRLRAEALLNIRAVPLTIRQQEVFETVCASKTRAEAAARLNISLSTLEKRLRIIKRRRGISDTRKWLKHDVAPGL